MDLSRTSTFFDTNTEEQPEEQWCDTLEGDHIMVPLDEDVQSNEIIDEKESMETPCQSSSSDNTVHCSFSFVDADGVPFSTESKSFLTRLQVVYVNAIVAANSLENGQEYSTKHGGTRQSKKHLLLYSEVGALTPPNTLGKVKFVKVKAKPNQLLTPGQEQILKLSTHDTSKSMDLNSSCVQKLLAQKPIPIQVKNEHEEYVVPVRHERSTDLIFTARTGYFPSQSSETKQDISSNSYQLVCYKNDKVMCQNFVPQPSVASYLHQMMTDNLTLSDECNTESCQQSEDSVQQPMLNELDLRSFQSRVEFLQDKHFPLDRTVVKTKRKSKTKSQSTTSSSPSNSTSTAAVEMKIKPRRRRKQRLHRVDPSQADIEGMSLSDIPFETKSSSSPSQIYSTPIITKSKQPVKRKLQKHKTEPKPKKKNLNPIRRRRRRCHSSLIPTNSKIEREINDPFNMNPINLVLLAAQNLEDYHHQPIPTVENRQTNPYNKSNMNNLMLLAEAASELERHSHNDLNEIEIEVTDNSSESSNQNVFDMQVEEY